jgi:GntR family transcriptional regulator, rspAB operon transcriptional repressor
MDLTRIQRKRATDEVYEAMRQAILTHVFKPGERLQVEEISQKLGVSLTPVRHALQQLATEGLIEIHPRSGTYVSTVSPEDIEETFEIRCALECLAAERAIGRITAAQIQHLRKLLEQLAKPLDTDESLKEHERANFELHQTLIDASGSRRIAELYDSLNAHIKIARIHASETAAEKPRDWETRLQREQTEHEAIVRALEEKDVAGVTAVLRKHIYRAKDALVKSLRATS